MGDPEVERVLVLTQPRVLGYVFNPVSFYYCHDVAGALHSIVAEITNTPWKERHSYVLPVAGADRHGAALRWDFRKAFHVSPFMDVSGTYRFLLAEPGGWGRIGFYSSGQLSLEDYYTLAVIGKAGIGTPHMDGNTRPCTATAP